MRRILAGTAALALAAGLGLAGCGDDDDGDTTSIDVQAIDYEFEDLPDEIDGGVVEVTLDNQGEVDHEIAFVNIGSEDNADSFFDDFGPVVDEGGPWPDYVTNAIGANEAAPGESGTFTYTLPEGVYMVFCALTGDADNPDDEEGGAPHFEEGMQQIVTVGEGEGDLPDGDGTITAEDYTFDVDLEEGDTVINYTNDGPNPHFAGFDRFPDGTSVEEAEEAFGTLLSLDEDEEPPDDIVFPESEDLGFSGIATEGGSIQFEVEELEAGTYIFYCFVSDLDGGPPHAIAEDMYVAIEIE